VTRWDALLCSINERLGGGGGQDIAPLGTRWAGEMVTLQRLQGENDSAWDTLKTMLRNG